MPASVQYNHNNGVYAIDSDSDTPGASEKNVLTWLVRAFSVQSNSLAYTYIVNQGTLLEKFLTTSPDDFKRFMRTHVPETPTPSEEESANANLREAYRYSKVCFLPSELQAKLFNPVVYSQTPSSCGPSLIVLTLDYLVQVFSISRLALLCPSVWI